VVRGYVTRRQDKPGWGGPAISAVDGYVVYDRNVQGNTEFLLVR
jgi:hypothetical protein